MSGRSCAASDARKLERVQEKALRAVYCSKTATYDTLLEMAKLPTLRSRRLQDVATLSHVQGKTSPVSEVY